MQLLQSFLLWFNSHFVLFLSYPQCFIEYFDNVSNSQVDKREKVKSNWVSFKMNILLSTHYVAAFYFYCLPAENITTCDSKTNLFASSHTGRGLRCTSALIWSTRLGFGWGETRASLCLRPARLSKQHNATVVIFWGVGCYSDNWNVVCTSPLPHWRDNRFSASTLFGMEGPYWRIQQFLWSGDNIVQGTWGTILQWCLSFLNGLLSINK